MQYPRYAAFTLAGFFLLLLGACSHLHVDTMDAWSPRDIHSVVYTLKDAPEGEADKLVRQQIRALGWEIAPDPEQADARLHCEFGYKTDLNSESEMVRTLESVHLRISDANDMRTQAVSDYFYAHGKENEWEEGVLAVFDALNEDGVRREVERGQTAGVPEVETSTTTETTEVAPKSVEVVEEARISTPKPESETEDAREPENIRSRADIPETTARTVNEPESIREPEKMEKSPWIPRFQGWGLEAWEGTE
ncbi:MAG: hypothetical protein ACP5FP_09650 [Desulfuromonadaceae bacterium]